PDAARRPGVRGPWHAAHRRTVEHGRAHDRVALARDPEAVLADRGVVEPERLPLLEPRFASRHRRRYVLLRLHHQVVELAELLRVLVFAQRQHDDVLLGHPAERIAGEPQNLFPSRAEVELGDARAAIFAITEPLEHRDLALEVLAHARDRDLRVLVTKPPLADGDELREDIVLPHV